MKKVLLSGHFGEKNAGDDLLLKSLVLELKEKFPELRDVSILTSNVFNTKQLLETENLLGVFEYQLLYSGRWGLAEAGKRFPGSLSWIIQLVREIRRADCLITGPGTLIKDNTHALFLVFWLIQCLIALLCRTSFCFLGVGVLPLQRGFSRAFLALLQDREKCLFFSTRDKRSSRVLESLHVTKEKIFTFCDFSFLLENVDSDCDITGKYPNKKLLGINLRDFSRKHFQEQEILDNYYQSLSEFLYYAWKTYDYQLVFIPFCTQEHQNDLKAIERLSFPEDFPIEDGIHILDCKNLEQLECYYHHFHAFIGTRFHANCTALRYHKPVMALSYEEKTINLFTDIEMEDFVVTIEELSVDKLKTIWQTIERDYDAIVAKQIRTGQELKTLARGHLTVLHEKMSE